MTNDLDVVVRLTHDKVGEFRRALPDSDFYCDEAAIHEAINASSHFNVIHPATALKIDVMVPPRNPYNVTRFARAKRVKPIGDWEAVFASPEDVILKKLEFFKEGGSTKHLRDIASILKVGAHPIDHDYIREWSERLGVLEQWRAALAGLSVSR